MLFAFASTASAIVIRSDVDDAEYRVPASAFPALADMPGEGHGVLIAPQWIVTAGHAAPSGMDAEVTVGGVAYSVERVITHPGYRRLPDALVKEALASGDFSKAFAFLASSDDIALIELASPVKDVIPVTLYRASCEVGMTVELIGKGATGNGIDGEVPHGSRRIALRRAFNSVTGADARYLWYQFDRPPSGLPLEGISGSGDSGGPVLIEDEGLKQLVGLGSWNKYAPADALQAGLYGQTVFNVRISSYIEWIESVISAQVSDPGGIQKGVAMTKQCPVCGMDVPEQDTAGISEHRGSTHYFCGDHCKQQFDSDPDLD